MASVRTDKGWLFLDFRFRGERCREFLNVRDGRDARLEANRIKRRLEAELRAGSFDYARRFPNSGKLERLGLRPLGSPTLAEFARKWLEERAPHLAPSTRYWYRCLLTAYVFSQPIAAKPIADITDRDLNVLVKHLTDRQSRSGELLSARTVNAVLARLRSIFDVALRRRILTDNPTAYVENLRETKPDVDPFDLREARALLDAARGWEGCFLAVLIFGGLRPNEAFALHWKDIDWEHGLIRVRRNATRFGLGRPKTRASERDVPMIRLVRETLTAQRARSALRGELVFPDAKGALFDLANFRNRNWPRIMRCARVRPRSPYQCRHTFARLLLERGENPQWIARALGHSSVQMVFQVYGRWGAASPESRALSRLDADARGACPSSAQLTGKAEAASGRFEESASIDGGSR